MGVWLPLAFYGYRHLTDSGWTLRLHEADRLRCIGRSTAGSCAGSRQLPLDPGRNFAKCASKQFRQLREVDASSALKAVQFLTSLRRIACPSQRIRQTAVAVKDRRGQQRFTICARRRRAVAHIILAEGSDIEEAHRAFIAIHNELTARFPCICDLPDEEVNDGAWSDGPLINNFGHCQAVIGFMYSSVESVLPFVIEVAHKYGVTVFDWQSGTIYRPR